MRLPLDDAGPTQERLAKAGEFFQLVGRSRSSRRITMLDDPLGKALVRRILSAPEYQALRRYALHWAAAACRGRSTASISIASTASTRLP
ncbi:hypothetical protein [Bradyrhizobium barranii]